MGIDWHYMIRGKTQQNALLSHSTELRDEGAGEQDVPTAGRNDEQACSLAFTTYNNAGRTRRSETKRPQEAGDA